VRLVGALVLKFLARGTHRTALDAAEKAEHLVHDLGCKGELRMYSGSTHTQFGFSTC
jgi:hypothetical protein